VLPTPPLARGTVGVLCALFAVRGIALVCVLPPGEMWDEYAHLAHVDHWAATGRAAVYGRTTVDPAFLAAMAALPQPTAAGFGRSYADFWAGRPAPPLPASLGLYEAQHPFLYYALAAPVYRACGGRANLPAAVAALRLINLACGVAAIALVLRWLGRRVSGPQLVLLGSWVALQPLLLLNVCRVADDALAFLLGTAVVVTALDLDGRSRALAAGAPVVHPGLRPRTPRTISPGTPLANRPLWPRVAAPAVLLPLSILAKATNVALVPVIVVAMFGVPRSRAIPATALILAITAAALFPYVAGNMRTFGLPTPMQEAVANRAAGRSVWAVLTAPPPTRWPVWAASWWVANGLWFGGWSFLRPPRLLVIAYATLLAVAAVAMVVRWRSLALHRRSRWTMLAVVAAVHLGLMMHATESYAAWDGRVLTNPWYAAVAVPWWLVLLGCGGLTLRRLRPWVMLGAPAVFVAAELVGLFARMLPAYYAAAPLSPTGLRRMASLHPAALGPATFAIALAAILVMTVALARRAYAVATGAPSAASAGVRW
jgi:hypothetical protein